MKQHHNTRPSWLPLVLGLCCIAPRGAGAQGLEELDGTYSYVGGQQQRRAVGEAIEVLLAEMNALYRSIARSRLTKAAEIAPSFTIRSLPGKRLSIRVGASPARETTLDGRPIEFLNEEGQPIKLTRTYRDGVLTTVGDRGDAKQQSVYHFSPDRSSFRLNVTISSSPLPRPLRFHLSYRKR